MPGEGSVYRRASDGRWVAQLSMGPRGERRVFTAYRHSRTEAVAALAELRARSGPIDRGTITVGAFLERWVRDARDIRPTTRHGYQAAVVTHILPALGHLRLVDLSPLHVEAMLADMAGRMAPKTARNVHVVLRRALGQAVRAGLVERNVASREFVDAPRVTVAEPDALSRDETDAILAAIEGDRLEPHVRLGLGTGLRQGEQLGLAWEDVDLERGVVFVRWELARVDGRYRRVEPKTPESRRMVPFGPELEASLRAHRETLIAAGFVPTATGPVFVNSDGGPLSGSVLTHRWYAILERAGVRRRPWKVLRATFRTRLYEAGVDEATINRLMGHTRTYTGRRHYQAPPDAMRAVGAMDAILRREADSHRDSHAAVEGRG